MAFGIRASAWDDAKGHVVSGDLRLNLIEFKVLYTVCI